MTASPSLILRPDYGGFYGGLAQFDLPATALSVQMQYTIAQAWLDRIGGALSVQCHPSAVRAEESYTSNTALGGGTEMWRGQCTGAWRIEASGESAFALQIAGACSEGPETQPTAAAYVGPLAYYNLDTASDVIPGSTTVTHSDGVSPQSATTTSSVSVGKYNTADEVATSALVPTQYLGILVGSGCFNTSVADLTSQSRALERARAGQRSGAWTYGGTVPAGNDYDPRTVTAAGNIPAGSGDGTGIAYVATCAISVARR